MKQNQQPRIIRRCASALLAAALLLVGLSQYAAAQDADRTTHTIEVRDGKVMVNGEVVSELEGDDYRIVFRRGDEGSVAVFGDDDKEGYFAFNELIDGYRLRSGANADFDVRSGNFARFFPDHSDREPFVFKMDGDAVFGAFSGDIPSAEVMQLEREARRLADRIRREDGDTADLETQLDETLRKIFDMKMESRVERMERLETQLQDLREQVDRRREDRQTIIEQRKQELLGRHGRYEW